MYEYITQRHIILKIILLPSWVPWLQNRTVSIWTRILQIFICMDYLLLRLVIILLLNRLEGLPWWLSGKESACQSRRPGFNPWVRKIPWRRACNPLQYSCLEKPMDRGAWWATVHGVTKSRTRLKWLSTSTIVGLQCCVSFRCTAKQFSCPCTYIHAF